MFFRERTCSDDGSNTKGFRYFNATQFLGAANDNLFKLLVIFYFVEAFGVGASAKMTAIAGGLFVIPFLLFSGAAGVLADRISKRRLVVMTKCAEVGIMAIGCTGFALNSPHLVGSTLFFMATQSAFFGPPKYGIIRELVPPEELSKANGQLTAMSQIGIISGTALASIFAAISGVSLAGAAMFCLLVAIAGLFTSMKVPHTEPAGSSARASWMPGADVARTIGKVKNDRDLLQAIIGAAVFTFVGAFCQLNLIPYTLSELGLSEAAAGSFFLITAAGVGLGSLLAGRLSGKDIELGLIPLGMAGLSLGALGLSAVTPTTGTVALMLLALGFSAGLFIVPLRTFI